MKKNLFYFILGLFVATTVCVGAGILYKARDIEFESSNDDWKVDNVQDAIKDIKDNYIPKSDVEGKEYIFDYTGDYQSFEVPYSGTYKIELWGAQGGAGNSTYVGGLGAYTSGEAKLKKGYKLYVYVGGTGKTISTYTSVGGYNGGGGVSSINNSISSLVGTGGGATDVRLVKGDDITDSVHYSITQNFDSLKSRIMVAAGGGGGTALVTSDNTSRVIGEAGGGLFGYAGSTPYYSSYGYLQKTSVATQTSGGLGAMLTNSHGKAIYVNGIFAVGGAAGWYPWGGGGAGYYGGGSGGGYSGSGSGGSSYISGHEGSNAIQEESTSSNIVHTGQSVHYSGYKFTNTVMIDGKGYNWTTEKGSKTDMPTHDGKSTMVGNTGNGYAKITLISID